MKNLCKLCATVSLLFVFSLSARAGDITIWGVAPPPPPPPPVSMTSDPGEITTWGAQNTVESEPLLTELTLSLVRLLSVF